MRSDRERLLDVLHAIENIEKYSVQGYDAYVSEELVQVWIVHHIQLIGEATASLSRELRESSPDIPWQDIIAMRNVLVHQYFGIDLREVWDTVTTDLPTLKNQVLSILDGLDE